MRAAAIASTARTVAVSTLPIGGSTRRSGRINQLVTRTIGIRHGVAKIRTHQLKQQAQHEGERQQPEKSIDDDI